MSDGDFPHFGFGKTETHTLTVQQMAYVSSILKLNQPASAKFFTNAGAHLGPAYNGVTINDDAAILDEIMNYGARLSTQATVKTPKTPRQICADAAEYIMEHGWIQGTLAQGEKVCAMGAIQMAAFGTTLIGELDPLSTPNDKAAQEALRMVTVAIRNLHPERPDITNIPEYNDLKSTTQEDILLILKKVAAGE